MSIFALNDQRHAIRNDVVCPRSPAEMRGFISSEEMENEGAMDFLQGRVVPSAILAHLLITLHFRRWAVSLRFFQVFFLLTADNRVSGYSVQLEP